MLDIALIHRARVVTVVRASGRDAQGSRQETAGAPVAGPWVAARVLELGGPPRGRRRSPNSSAAQVVHAFEVLFGAELESGEPWAGPPPGARIQTDCGVLGNPTIDLDGRAETLNDGEDVIGYRAFGDVPGDAS